MKPDFIGVYAGGSGTSWLYNCLIEHPQLCLPFKIINFFNDDQKYEKGIEWYENHFWTCRQGVQVGEISLYLHSLEAAERIYSYHPKVKLLVILRNPVDRAFSAYENELSTGILPPETSFQDALQDRPLYIRRGFYFEALKRYLDYFSRDQIFVAVHEDGLRDPAAYVRSFYEFLGVDPSFEPSLLRQWVSAGGVPRSAFVTRSMNRLAEQMRTLGFQRLIWLLKRSGAVSLLHRANRKSTSPAMTREERVELQTVYEPDIRALENLIQRDLSEWRKTEGG